MDSYDCYKESSVLSVQQLGINLFRRVQTLFLWFRQHVVDTASVVMIFRVDTFKLQFKNQTMFGD